jgi:uncharacterized protein GlcG (DUF336 family)
LLTCKDLSASMAMATAIASGALDDYKARGFNISVVVVDRAGDSR